MRTLDELLGAIRSVDDIDAPIVFALNSPIRKAVRIHQYKNELFVDGVRPSTIARAQRAIAAKNRGTHDCHLTDSDLERAFPEALSHYILVDGALCRKCEEPAYVVRREENRGGRHYVDALVEFVLKNETRAAFGMRAPRPLAIFNALDEQGAIEFARTAGACADHIIRARIVVNDVSAVKTDPREASLEAQIAAARGELKLAEKRLSDLLFEQKRHAAMLASAMTAHQAMHVR